MPRGQAATIEEAPDMPITQRRVAAAGAAFPATTAPRSVFEAGTPRPVPAAQIQIRKGMPLPPIRRHSTSQYLPVIERMAAGDMVELPSKQARGFLACAKLWATTQTPPRHFSIRTLSPVLSGVWRDR